MDYKGYQVIKESNKIIIHAVKDFLPKHVFECGQCFRWFKESDGGYTGVVKGKVAKVYYSEGRLEIVNATFQDFAQVWYDYFDLGRDYGEIKKMLCKDDIMKQAIAFGYGMRLLKQDPWETLISFIISSNSNIPKIIQTISSLSREFGNEILFNDKSYFTFPNMDSLIDSSIQELQVCKGGYRCKYIYQTSKIIKAGLVNFNSLCGLTTEEARNELIKLPGVGNKVADCAVLFSGIKHDVFPTDVWVKRVMEELYFKQEVTIKEIQSFARDYFGELAGFAQQFLFYYAREKRIGVKQ